MELESEHTDRRNEEQGGQYGDQQHPVRRKSDRPLLPQHAERSAEKRSGRRRKSAEFDRLRFVDVELGQTQRGKRRQDEHAIPQLPGRRQTARFGLQANLPEHCGRSQSRGNDIRQRIELHPDRRRRMQQTGHETIEKSNTIPATISQKASVKSLYISAATTANDPQSRFMRVNKFGIVKSRIRICKRISPPISRQI